MQTDIAIPLGSSAELTEVIDIPNVRLGEHSLPEVYQTDNDSGSDDLLETEDDEDRTDGSDRF